MASVYVTTAEIKSYLGITSSTYDTLLGIIIESCEGLFNKMIESKTGLIESTKTEYHSPDDYSTNQQGRILFLRSHNPTSITTINGSDPGTLNADYTLDGRRIELKTALTWPSEFPYKWPVVYVSGYASDEVPNDVKLAIMLMVSAYWINRKSAGISSFKQDLLSVTYDRSSLESLLDPAQSKQLGGIVGKYKIPKIYAT